MTDHPLVPPLAVLIGSGLALAAATGETHAPPDTVRYWADILRDIGFPIAVSGYLLWRIEPRLVQLSEVLHDIRGYLMAEHDHKRDE